jgi:hypothetical protein
MNERRTYAVTFQFAEVLAALKAAFPTNLSVLAIPEAAGMESECGAALRFQWQKIVTPVMESP